MVGGPCSFDGCRKTALFKSQYCYKHKNLIGEKNQQIRFDIDGNSHSTDSKQLDHMYKALRKSKKFWIVDLGIDEDEFVQYAIENGVLEHWDNKEMVESMEMPVEKAFEILESKITGDYGGHTLWWSNEEIAPEENIIWYQDARKLLILVVVVITFGAMIRFDPDFVGEACINGLCFLGFAGGAGAATSLGRSESGKFTDE